MLRLPMCRPARAGNPRSIVQGDEDSIPRARDSAPSGEVHHAVMDEVVVSVGVRTIVKSILVGVGVVAAVVALHASHNVLTELTLAVGVAVLARPAVLW